MLAAVFFLGDSTVGCSYCLCRTVSPATIRFYELPLLLFLIRPYQCDHWPKHRFFRFWPLQAMSKSSRKSRANSEHAHAGTDKR
jgi:hypothetical protein